MKTIFNSEGDLVASYGGYNTIDVLNGLPDGSVVYLKPGKFEGGNLKSGITLIGSRSVTPKISISDKAKINDYFSLSAIQKSKG